MHDAAPVFPALQRGLRRLRLIFDTWYPWDHKQVVKKIQPLVFRPLEERDIEWCEKLYIRNELCGIPENGRAGYSGYLRENSHLVLIAEASSGRVGTFGIHWSEEDVGFLSYVLVDPGAHRSGVGTTMLLAAIALLGTDAGEKCLVLNAFDSALGFYRKMGYIRVHSEDFHGRPLSYAALGPITAQLVVDCRGLLRNAGARLPDLSANIPFSPQPIFPAA